MKPFTFAGAVRQAKRTGLSARDVWRQVLTNCRDTAKKENWRPSELAMTLADHQHTIARVYDIDPEELDK